MVDKHTGITSYTHFAGVFALSVAIMIFVQSNPSMSYFIPCDVDCDPLSVTPILISPENGATVSAIPVALDWSSTKPPGGWYRLYYKKSSDSSWVYVTQLTSSTYALSGLSGDSYQWFVTACNSAGECSGNSETWSFTLAAASPTAGAITAADTQPPAVSISASSSVSYTVTLTATATDDTEVSSIKIYVDDDGNPGNAYDVRRVCDSFSCSVASVVLGPYNSATTVNYYALAYDSAGNMGYSGVSSIVISPISPPTPSPTPVLITTPPSTSPPAPPSSPTPTPTPTPSASPTPTPTPAPIPFDNGGGDVGFVPVPAPSPTPTPVASPTPSPSPTPTAGPSPTASPTPPSGGGSSGGGGGSSGSSGGGGGSSASSTGVSNVRAQASSRGPSAAYSWDVIEAQKPAFVKVDKGEISIYEIELRLKEKTENPFMRIVFLQENPAGIPASLKVYQYMGIDHENIDDNNVGTTFIRFGVDKKWMEENDIEKSGITLQRYESSWKELPTRAIREDADSVFYEAQTPGFSRFMITGKSIAAEPRIEQPAPVEQDVITGETTGEAASSPIPISDVVMIALFALAAGSAFMFAYRKRLTKDQEEVPNQPV